MTRLAQLLNDQIDRIDVFKRPEQDDLRWGIRTCVTDLVGDAETYLLITPAEAAALRVRLEACRARR